MTSISLREPPRGRTVAGEQIRAVGLGLRNEGIAYLVILGLFGALAIAQAFRFAHNNGFSEGLRYGPGFASVTLLVGLLLLGPSNS